VFPIDWLVIENIMNLDKSQLDIETKIRLRDVYEKILRDEKRMRK